MIASQRINSTTDKPKPYKDFIPINVLKWSNSKWKTLCPYYLRTDGEEKHANGGNILFENYYQGIKVYDIVYENEVYPSRYHENNPKFLWWKFIPQNVKGDVLINPDGSINYDLYNNWKNQLWNCENPIRYPNKINRRKNVQFGLFIDKHGNEIRMDYLTLRKTIYVAEYIRLVKKTKEYGVLLEMLKNGQKLMICEVDVPANGKKSLYGVNCNEDNISELTLDILMKLMDDPNEAFGHGLCLIYSLLVDLL